MTVQKRKKYPYDSYSKSPYKNARKSIVSIQEHHKSMVSPYKSPNPW